MSKSKRRGKDLEDAGDSSAGLFNMDPNAPYRTHMLFPGRKEDDCGGPDPRRSSGSPSFMKTMMGWGGKRPSDPPRNPGNGSPQRHPHATARRSGSTTAIPCSKRTNDTGGGSAAARGGAGRGGHWQRLLHHSPGKPRPLPS